MTTPKVETVVVTIHMAGDLCEAKRFLRKICYYEGLCGPDGANGSQEQPCSGPRSCLL
jgi:hypothetical protein